ncbi:MAG: hypothetical protein WEC83_02385 [Patescibacteria group bacterium]
MNATMTQAMQQLFLGQTEGLDKFQLQDLTQRRRRALEKIENMNGEFLFVVAHFDHEEGYYAGETFFYDVNGSLCSVSTTTHIQSYCGHGGPTDELATRALEQFLAARRDHIDKAKAKLAAV